MKTKVRVQKKKKKTRPPLMPQSDLATRLVEARVAAGYLSPELAAADGLSFGVRTLRKYEAGVEPTAGKLRELAVHYRKSTDWLLRIGRWAGK